MAKNAKRAEKVAQSVRVWGAVLGLFDATGIVTSSYAPRQQPPRIQAEGQEF